MQLDPEQARRRAKELLRAARHGEVVLRDDRAPRLADAQHAVARELGFRSWAAMLDSDREVRPGPQYVTGSPVVVRIRHRANRYDIDDRGEAVRRAGRPRGWLAAAEAAVGAHALNVNRAGVVFVQSFESRDTDGLAHRIAEASVAVYDAVLELDR